MSEFKMPSLGADMEAGTLIEWLVKPGSRVKRGDIIAVVDTEKAAIDVEVWVDGVVEQLLIQPGIRVPVGTVLAIIRAEGAAEPAAAAAAVLSQPLAAPRPQAGAPAAPVLGPAPAVPAPGQERHRASPLARRMAETLGVDLSHVSGTGPGGTITHTDVEQAAARGPAAGEAPHAATPRGAAARGAADRGTAGRLRVSPLARRLAKELGVDLAGVVAAGAEGAISAADVQRSAAVPQRPAAPGPSAPSAPSASQGAPVAPKTPKERSAAMRRAIAQAMTRSKREIPHYYLGLEIDLDRALKWIEAENAKRSIVDRVLYSVLLIKAVALAAREVPELNGFWIDDGFKASEAVHVGMAISLRGGGLVAPALRFADRQPLGELMRQLRDLVARARAGSLRSSELSDPTLTITNLGEQGVDTVFGIIFPPQVALVGFGRVSPRRTLQASLSADHRASDGHRGGLFLAAIDRRLQSPETL